MVEPRYALSSVRRSAAPWSALGAGSARTRRALHSGSRSTRSWLAAALLLTSGCAHEPLQPIWPVHGRLVQSDGSPVTSGALRFQSELDPRSIVFAELASDGRFEAMTLQGSSPQPGASSGRYEVVFSPMQGEAPSEWPVVFSEPVTIEPGENQLSLVLPAKKAKRGAAPSPKR